jgi:hypothetical protein
MTITIPPELVPLLRDGRRELEGLARDGDPEVIGDALRGLQAAGVVILDGERVRPSRCAVRLDALGVICL